LVNRDYVNEQGGSLDGPGVLVHEGYAHNFCDRELCGLARHRGLFAFAARARVEHHHPLFSRAVPMDDTYKKGLEHFREDQQLFYRRAVQWGYQGLSAAEIRLAKRQR
jgi:hypothetical protein